MGYSVQSQRLVWSGNTCGGLRLYEQHTEVCAHEVKIKQHATKGDLECHEYAPFVFSLMPQHAVACV
jgi:hypothetical protein